MFNGNEYGSFNKDDPYAISLTPSVFGKANGAARTGLKGILYHEVAHNYEYNTYGKVGALKQFSELKSFPTTYGSTSYNYEGYGKVRPESFSTTVEQVATQTLRKDALMRDGNSVYDVYHDKYGKYGTMKEMYDFWANDWLPLVKDAKRMTGL